jgi:Bifunctional DNA primase/polymerase, N-terminal
MDIKGPMLPTYAEHYKGVPVPESVYADWRTTNVQLVTGAKSPSPTKIIVVDLDSDPARNSWQRILANHYDSTGSTWVAKTGGGGRHYYFTLPPGVTECQSGMIWGLWDTYADNGKGGWVKHHEIRILADNALVVAPPSIHIDTKQPYAFGESNNPKHYRLPAIAPDWLLAMPRLSAPRFGALPKPAEPLRPSPRSSHYYTREEVLDAVGSRKFEIATEEWGLVSSVTRPNPSGWCPCFVPGREDPRYSKPSGSFNWSDGTLQDRKDLTTISFFDLGVALGRYQTWQDCRDDLGDRFIGKRFGDAAYKYAF